MYKVKVKLYLRRSSITIRPHLTDITATFVFCVVHSHGISNVCISPLFTDIISRK